MGILTKSLVTAAAVAALYGTYSIGKNSADLPQCKTVEEAVCEEIDTDTFWESGRRAGYMEGLNAGRREGEAIGERTGNEEGFARGNSYGYNLGLSACSEERYNAGLNACDDTNYQDGMIEGEKLGLEEGRRRFLGSGTYFHNTSDDYSFYTNRTNQNDGTTMAYIIRIDKGHLCAEEILIITYPKEGASKWLFDGRCFHFQPARSTSADGLVDQIQILGERTNFLYRELDISAHEEEFLGADRMMQEARERLSSSSEFYE